MVARSILSNGITRSPLIGATALSAGPVVVPADFLGTHMHRWPTGLPPTGLSPAPTGFNYKAFRTHDGGGAWASINTADGVYDWTFMDAAITAHRTAGVTVMWTVFETPEWAATTAGQAYRDPYYRLGGSDRPQNLSDLSTFVTALVTRYNAVGGAWRVANPTLGVGIKSLQTWNEPQFAANGSETWTSTHFFWRSKENLVDMAETIRAAAKAVDADILVLSPAFQGSAAVEQYARPWLTATGGVTGVTGLSTMDGLCVHAYYATDFGLAGIETGPAGGLKACRQLLADVGASNMPIYVTEFGVASGESPVLTAFLASPATNRRARIGRTAIMAAIYGAKQFYTFAYDQFLYLCGDLMTDTAGVRAGFNDAASICGTTLTNAYLLSDGRIKVDVNGTTQYF